MPISISKISKSSKHSFQVIIFRTCRDFEVTKINQDRLSQITRLRVNYYV